MLLEPQLTAPSQTAEKSAKNEPEQTPPLEAD